MSFWNRHTPCGSLEEWLRIATRDLCRAARERIALEITTHFGEAVAAQVAEGNSLAVAELVAIDQLGDPETAGKRFRKRHLTVKEFEFAEGKRKVWLKASRRSLIWRSILAALLPLIVWHTGSKADLIFAIVFAVSMIPFNALSYRAARAPKEFATRRLGITAISLLLLLFVGAGILSCQTGSTWMVVMCVVAIEELRWVPIVYKATMRQRDGVD